MLQPSLGFLVNDFVLADFGFQELSYPELDFLETSSAVTRQLHAVFEETECFLEAD